jgi:hypothetical protein
VDGGGRYGVVERERDANRDDQFLADGFLWALYSHSMT